LFFWTTHCWNYLGLINTSNMHNSWLKLQNYMLIKKRDGQ
jgi:hypothetical protein